MELGTNDSISLVANQDKDCISIHQGNPEIDCEDIVHICDWPALKKAIDEFQLKRGGAI